MNMTSLDTLSLTSASLSLSRSTPTQMEEKGARWGCLHHMSMAAPSTIAAQVLWQTVGDAVQSCQEHGPR